jgi:hypothetical protein
MLTIHDVLGTDFFCLSESDDYLSMKCEHCPVADSPCHGERIARMCELMNLLSPVHNPAYGPVLVGMATDPETLFRQTEAARIAWEALPPDQRRSGCCGGDAAEKII